MPSSPRPKFVALCDFELPGQLGSFRKGDPITGYAANMPNLVRDGFVGKATRRPPSGDDTEKETP